MNYKQRDIILVPFPFSDLSAIKQRPVLILSQDKDSFNSDDIITCGITSYLKDARNSVLINNIDLEEGAIPKQSRIKVGKLFTLNKSIIRRKLARLNKKTFELVKRELIQLI